MKIQKIEFKNGYKRFHHLTIDLGACPKRIVALVGANGCGKSSVFDGMLYIANAHARVGSGNIDRDFEYHSLHKEPAYNYQNVEVFLDKGNFSDVFKEKKKNGKENTIYSLRSSYRYNSSLKITSAQATAGLEKNNYGASYSSDLDAKMEQSYRRLYVKYNDYLNSNDCRPSEAKVKIIGDLNSSIENCLDLKISSLGSIEDSKGTLFFKKTDHPTEFEFNVLSSGEKEVVDILLDLYLRQSEYTDSIFIIDEPELHLNTSIQRKLLIEIDKLIGDECQLWVATHSIGFMRALQSELKDKSQVIFFPSDNNWAANEYLLTPIMGTRLDWRNIFETALDDLAGLVSPNRIVYCEGRDSPGQYGGERGLDANVYNIIFNEKHVDTLFVSSGGNTELDLRSDIAIRILSKVFDGLEILVLKDRDMASGRANDENDRKIYLENNPPNHRVLIRWEIENYLFDKTVLSAYCSENGLLFNEEKYDQFVNDIVNQNLKDATGRIKSICGITSNVNSETFKINLAKYVKSDSIVYLELESCVFV